MKWLKKLMPFHHSLILVDLLKKDYDKITEIEGKILGITGLATTTTTALDAVENQTPRVKDLVKKIYMLVYQTLRKNILLLLIIIYNKYMNDIPDAKIKNKKLVLKSDNFQLINNSDSVKEIATLATKVDLKAD